MITQVNSDADGTSFLSISYDLANGEKRDEDFIVQPANGINWQIETTCTPLRRTGYSETAIRDIMFTDNCANAVVTPGEQADVSASIFDATEEVVTQASMDLSYCNDFTYELTDRSTWTFSEPELANEANIASLFSIEVVGEAYTLKVNNPLDVNAGTYTVAIKACYMHSGD